MVSTVRPRPNHYERLGLSPAAASDEIARAFARATSVLRPHAFGSIAEACVAYETLRDPIKRRAYDASIGLKPKAVPPAPVTDQRAEALFPRRMSPYPVERSAVAVRPGNLHGTPVSRSVAEATTVNAPQQRQPVGNNIGATAIKTEPLRPAEAEARPLPKPQIDAEVSHQLSLEERLGVETSPIDWKRTGMAAGAIAGAACLIGAMAGWWSAGDIGKQPQAKNAVSLPLPPAKGRATSEDTPPDMEAAGAMPGRLTRSNTAAPNTRPPVLPATGVEPTSESAPQESMSEESEAGLGASVQAAPADPLAPAVAASMPLPNRVIARTIERIGYSCGSVASTSPVEGDAPGVFKVTCASGQSYQASPVNGRYRFRRWGRQ